MRKKNIVLIGMSGAGKSTLGVLLAKAVGMNFTDTDILIQQQENKKLQEIIDLDGIEKFLQIEESVISKLSLSNYVIATGGSVVYSEKAMHTLKENGIIVYLFVSPEELHHRLTNIKTRGIVMKDSETFDDVLNDRLPLYSKYSDITLDFTKKDIEECVSELIEAINNQPR